MHDKGVNNYPPTISFVSECYKIYKIFDKAISRCFLYFILFPIDTRPKKYVTEVFPKIFLCYQIFSNRYKTQRKCDKAVDDCLAVIKLISDEFGTSKMLKAFHML